MSTGVGFSDKLPRLINPVLAAAGPAPPGRPEGPGGPDDMKGIVIAAARIAQTRASTGKRWRLTQMTTGLRSAGGGSGGGAAGAAAGRRSVSAAALGRTSVLAAGVGWSRSWGGSAPSGSLGETGSTGATAAGGGSTTVGNRASDGPGRLDTAVGGGDAVWWSCSGMTIAAAVGVRRSAAGVSTVPGGGDSTVPGGGDSTVPGGGDSTVPGGVLPPSEPGFAAAAGSGAGDDTGYGSGPAELRRW